MKKYKQAMSVVSGPLQKDIRERTDGRRQKHKDYPSLLATGFSSRAGLGSAERLDLSSSTGLVEGRTGQVGIMKCHFGRV